MELDEYKEKSIVIFGFDDSNEENEIFTNFQNAIDTVFEEILIENEIQQVVKAPEYLQRLKNERSSLTPPKYRQIFDFYKRKEYKECINYIDLVNESTTTFIIEYQILKATCLVKLNTKFTEAHQILDDILQETPNNVFCIYAKGRAYYHESQWIKSIDCFNKAIALDPRRMKHAEVLKKLAERKIKCQAEDYKMEIDHPEDIQEKFDKIRVVPSQSQINSRKMNQEKPLLNVKEKKTHPKDVRCDICLKFYSRRSIKTHQFIHTGKKDFVCKDCGKAFYQNGDLKRHESTVHSDVFNFECNLCDQKFKIKKNLQAHIKRRHHKGKMDFVCKDCGRAFYQKRDLQRHESTVHTGKKDFVCKDCGRAFYQKRDLQRHESTVHTGKKDFVCKDCGRAFYQKRDLQRHESTVHTGKKDFVCKDCGKAFYHNHDLQRHKSTVHSDVFNFECNLCNQKFKIKKYLQRHTKRRHPELI